MSNAITILLGSSPEDSAGEGAGFESPRTKRGKLDLDPQQLVDKLTPFINALEKVSTDAKGTLNIYEAELCIGVDLNGNVGIRPLGGVEAGLKTAAKVTIRRKE